MKGGGMMAVWAGKSVTLPLGPDLTRMIKSVEVHDRFDGQSGFRITFGAARDGSGYPLLASSPLQPMARVQILFGWCLPGTPLINGVVVDRRVYPNNLTDGDIIIDGRDLTVLMDQEEKVASFQDMTEPMIAAKVLLSYAGDGVIPSIASPTADPPISPARTPVQRGTDLDHLYRIADRFGFAFGLRPGPEPMTNIAYWGPWKATGSTKGALTAGLPFLNNVEYLNVHQRGLAWKEVRGSVQDPLEDQLDQVSISSPSLTPLAAQGSPETVRRKRLMGADSGLSELQARAFSQGLVDTASMNAMALEGALDVSVYGDFLRAGDKVSVRGMGATSDGAYMVARVVHKLAPGSFRQEFMLKREGIDPTSPVVKT